MDSSSCIHVATRPTATAAAASCVTTLPGAFTTCIPAVFQCREQEHELLLVSSQIQQHLNQISMQLNIDDESAADYGQRCSSVVDDLDFLPNSFHATSSSLCCSPEISSTAAHVLAAAATGLQFPEVSSLVAPGVVLPYLDQYAAKFYDMSVTTETSASAFRYYERHLGPQRRLKKPANGQKMFKTAMSVLAKMHTVARYNHQQQQKQYNHQQQLQQQLALETEPSESQLQHMVSERKRRGRLNDSFHALKTVLPPGSKKDRTSTLITAREYVNSLKSKVCELEEKSQALLSQLARRATIAEEDDEKVEIQVTRAAAAEDDQTGEVCMVKIVTRPARGNASTTDMVLKTLQCLKDQMGEDVSLVSMSTGDDDSDGPHRASLTLHLKSASGTKWDEEPVREAVTKAVTSPAPAGLVGAE